MGHFKVSLIKKLHVFNMRLHKNVNPPSGKDDLEVFPGGRFLWKSLQQPDGVLRFALTVTLLWLGASHLQGVWRHHIDLLGWVDYTQYVL